MNENEIYLVGSFSYNSKDASEKAYKEQNKIMKLESQMDYSNPKIVYSVYCKVVEKNILETLEGVNYLVHLQNYLYENENNLPGPIPAIPADMLNGSKIFEVASDIQPSVVVNSTVDSAVTNDTDTEQLKNQLHSQSEEIEKLVEKNRRLISDNKKLRSNKDNPIVYKIIIGFLVVLIGVMLFIAMRSDSPNIINYRNKIQNEYSDWEQQLKDKEAELNQRERELNK